jgi:uncharacterized membrane protein
MRTVAKCLLAGLWLVCVYRAITQSLVHDEALTWQLYIDAPVANIFQVFDANHHFLNTVLMRFCASVFGMSEWALRLPALAGAALYFVAVYRLSRSAFGEGLTFLLAVAALALNPFTLDFMVAARGYGMALALLMWALAALIRMLSFSEPLPRKELVIAGTALALSVTANLVFVFPAAFLALAFVILVAHRSRAAAKPAPEPKAKHKKVAQPPARNPVWRWFVLPAVCVGVLFFILAPFSSATQASFYAGASTISESLRSLASVTLEHGGPLRESTTMHVCRDAVAFVLAPALLVAGLWIGAKRRDVVFLLAAIPAAASALAWLGLHWIADLPYPMDRTGVYFVPLVTIVLIRMTALPARVASAAAYALATILVVVFASQFDTRKFVVWEYDADTRQLVQEIAKRRAPNARAVRVGGSWQLEPSLNFYRSKNNWAAWMGPVDRQAVNAPADFYALIPQDREAIRTQGLAQLWEGPVSHTVLAAPPPR